MNFKGLLYAFVNIITILKKRIIYKWKILQIGATVYLRFDHIPVFAVF
jgi:hypothetical protein